MFSDKKALHDAAKALAMSSLVAEAVISKGVVTRFDLYNALEVLRYEGKVPDDVYRELQDLIDGLPGDSDDRPRG